VQNTRFRVVAEVSNGLQFVPPLWITNGARGGKSKIYCGFSDC
jgi:hypothetical protein